MDGHTKGKEKQCSELNFSLFLFVPSLFFSFLSCAGVGFESNSTLHPLLRVYLVSTLQTPIKTRGSVCKVRTQDPENLDEEVKSLVTAWRLQEIPQCQALPKTSRLCLATSSSTSSPSQGPLFSLSQILGFSLRAQEVNL